MNYKDVLNKIAIRNKSIQPDSFDLQDTCSEVVRTLGKLDFCEPFHGFEVDMAPSGFLNLPCNFYKLDELMVNNARMNADEFKQISTSGIKIMYPERYKSKFVINYYGLPVEEDGSVTLATESVVEAAYWHWLLMTKLEDFLNGKITAQAYDYIEENKQHWFGAAGSDMLMWNKNRYDRLSKIRMNIHIRPTLPKKI